MKLAALTDDQSKLLKQYSFMNGVVDFFILECDANENAQNSSTHHKAVLLAFDELRRQADEYAEKTSETLQIPMSSIFQITINETQAMALVPQRISWQQFLGPRFDFIRHGLIINGKGTFHNKFFFFSDTPSPENIVPSDGIDDGIGTGFAYAFSDPPYGLSASAEEVGYLFDEFLRLVICGSAESLIYEWATDWSNYFEAGQEWWGSFLWSLSNPGSQRIVVIAASATD